MKIDVFEGQKLSELSGHLQVGRYDFAAIHLNCALDPCVLDAAGMTVHGATSCQGAMTQGGVTTGFAAFAISDPKGAYGTAMADITADPQTAAALAAREALEAADRMGEVPDLVWLSTTPGSEESVLAGVQSVVGAQTPIIGGSAADNDITGQWCVFDGASQLPAGVVVSVLFPSRPVSFAYQNGYSPTKATGTVTRASGRTVFEIDGQSAVETYSKWTNGDVSGPADGQDRAAILSDCTLWPVGRRFADVGTVPFYLLAHPAVARSDGGLEMFATVAEGEELTLMTGTRRGLVDRAGRVAALACTTGNVAQQDVLGALVVYCGGCMLAVQDDLSDVVAGVNTALGGAPFLGTFTFGEQGTLLGEGNRHGNLMISCVVFG